MVDVQFRYPSMQKFTPTPFLLGACLLASSLATAEPIAPETTEFIENYCIRCHNDVDLEGGLDLETFIFEPDNQDNFDLWVKIHDMAKSGEMPRGRRKKPSDEAATSFTEQLSDTLIDHEQAMIAENGRAVQRRLNRYEYENALRDLLSIPWIQVRNRLPEDGEAHRYNKIGEALDVSHIQMARYMSSADYALRQAMSQQLSTLAPTTTRYYAREEPSLRNFWPRQGSTLSDRLSFPLLDGKAQPDVRAGREPVSNPETRDREAVGKVISTFSDAGGYSWGKFRAPAGGRYKLRFKGYSLWMSGGGISRWFFEGVGEEKAPVYWLPLSHRPNLDEAWPGRRDEPIGVYARSTGQGRLLGNFDFTPKANVHELEVILQPNEIIQTDGSRLIRTRVNGTNEQYVNPLAKPDGLPGYAVQWMEVEGPLDEPTGYSLLFGSLPLHEAADGGTGILLEIVPPNPTENNETQRRRRRIEIVNTRFEVASTTPTADAQRLLQAFMDRAYRRPVQTPHFERFLKLFQEQYDLGHGFAQSLISTYTAVLASPGFLFVEEQPGTLDDYALATRLALFLSNSEPDAELRELAANGSLHHPEILRVQTDRLINDPKSHRFVNAFTDYWLDLRKFNDTSPSATLYNDYELDDPLKQAARAETQLFVHELLQANLPARNIADSNFTYLNERLANHYEIPNVHGAKMRKVELPANSPRGGLLTQASVLKVTANGTTTSPVIRGNWITERILGYLTPPPPPVASVEPDIRGAITIREQLAAHRSDRSCATCHARMDPPGFALESFDVMGGWRDRYRAINEQTEPVEGVGLNGQAFSFHHGLPVDSAGELPDGRAFTDVSEFKKLLIEDDETIARNLVRQLTIYATGAPVRFSERPAIETILQNTSSQNYGFRSIVHEIVQSDLFQNK